MTNSKLRSAHLKIDRATKHIDELNELLRKERPFFYVVETNVEAGYRATGAKQNESVVEQAALIAADALHGLRTALDHAYWEVVSPFAANGRGADNVQFPFSKTAARLEEAVKNRLANRVSPEFFSFIVNLRPYGEAGGNELLYLLNDQDAVDKHRTLIPTGDYKRLTTDMLRRQIPDFPTNLSLDGNFGQSNRDIMWPLTPEIRRIATLTGVFEQKIDVPVEIVFQIRSYKPWPLVPTLHELTGMVTGVVKEMTSFI